MKGKLILEDNSEFEGMSFGANKSAAGEVVFSTGMVGYPQAFTDPSFTGQILILTYPIIGNYGVPDKKYWESDGLKISGLIVSNYIDTPSHFQSKLKLSQWLKKENVPALEIADTRGLTQKIREKGVMLGKVIVDHPEQNLRVKINFIDPNKENLVAKVSTKVVTSQGQTLRGKTVLLIDCGAKRNIAQCLVNRGVKVITVPWDFDPYSERQDPLRFDAVVISNGPGDPKMADKTISIIKKFIEKKIPVLGICLGHQLLALAAGGDTQKLKFGHRSQNQPCIMKGSKRCFITTQNHGFHVSKIPKGFKPWFTNANDGSNEGIIHKKLPFMSVQFHPEAMPGPVDTEWIFDYFLEKI
ncbi:MAG: glutamine-hydrolyzing carbamoyl-phosphate synthase small subunit [Candidatus Levybacteria bacterium]|nr:glutamine-hydrolyzing carbamoyl-phosphate synthase small subunit [Candidatus Levybacteria bacterium]